MNLTNAGLVLEGGGLRGVFTSGVLRRLMDEGVGFASVYGVSMGACNGANYVARQPERNRTKGKKTSVFGQNNNGNRLWDHQPDAHLLREDFSPFFRYMRTRR